MSRGLIAAIRANKPPCSRDPGSQLKNLTVLTFLYDVYRERISECDA